MCEIADLYLKFQLRLNSLSQVSVDSVLPVLLKKIGGGGYIYIYIQYIHFFLGGHKHDQ